MVYYLQGYETVIQRREREKRERAAVAAEAMAEAAAKAAGVEEYRTYLEKKAERQRTTNAAKAMAAGAAGKDNPFVRARTAGAAAGPFAGAKATARTGTSQPKKTTKKGSGTGTRSPSPEATDSESDGQVPVDYFQQATGITSGSGERTQPQPPKKSHAVMWIAGLGVLGGAAMYGLLSKGKGRKR